MRHNFVYLNGQILSEPKITKDTSGRLVRGMCAINVIRGKRDFGNNIDDIQFDCPIIMTGDPEKIQRMSEWHANDMIEVKGTITTKEVTKSTICKHCGEKNSASGVIVYINPIYMDVRERGLTREQGLEVLRRRAEVSNNVLVIGALCRDVESYITAKGVRITQYQLAINRKFMLKDDIAENRTDYPWVKSYGSIGEEAEHCLHTGSVVMIDGMLQTRRVQRTTVCEHCGESYNWEDSATEITPFSVEFLQNFDLPEEYEEKIRKENEILAEKIFKNED